MKKTKVLFVMSLFASFFLFAACGEEPVDIDNDTELNGNNGEHSGDEYSEDEHGGDEHGGDEHGGDEHGGDEHAEDEIEENVDPAEVYELTLSWHGAAGTKLCLSTMTISAKDDLDTHFDIELTHEDEITLEIAPHVQAINLGNQKDFHEVEEVPESDYLSDGETVDDFVIGKSYHNGGTCSGGFRMSGNVYAIRIDHGDNEFTYAKIQVAHAHAGDLRLIAYHQPNGTRDVRAEH